MNVSVKTLLAQKARELTSSESKVADTLLSKYPSAGLTSISSLAARAGVSDPTVFRLVIKLGFDGFPAFQQALLDEVDETMRSPFSMLANLSSLGIGKDPHKEMLACLAGSLANTAEQTSPEDFGRALDLLSASSGAVFCGGGRASAFLATRLATHLSYIRPHVSLIRPSLGLANEAILDMSEDDLLVIFDYRRYQKSVIQFAEEAKRRGVSIILFTDEWKSPIARFADAILCSFIATASPFDTKVPALAQCEALVAALLARFPERTRERLAHVEALRSVSDLGLQNE